MIDLFKAKSDPFTSTGSAVQIFLIALTYSSARLPLVVQSVPAASYSSGDQPMPKPTLRRPADRTSNEARVRASKTGLYQGKFNTLVPMPILFVRAAANAIV